MKLFPASSYPILKFSPTIHFKHAIYNILLASLFRVYVSIAELQLCLAPGGSGLVKAATGKGEQLSFLLHGKSL